MRKLKDELALALTTVKQLKDSEVGHLVKSNAQHKEVERLTKENRDLLEQLRQLKDKKAAAEEEVKKESKQQKTRR